MRSEFTPRANMENKRKHLEFIQAAVNRMASNLFLLKGWTVTLIAALFALAAKDAKPVYFAIAYFPPFMFWVLDGYFLSQERRFRSLYDHVRKLPESPRPVTIPIRAHIICTAAMSGHVMRAVQSNAVPCCAPATE